MASNLFDFIGEQNALSGIQDWAQQQYGNSNPALASLAQADPRSFRDLLPKLIEKQQETSALKDYYGTPQPDASGITWNPAPPVTQAPSQAQQSFPPDANGNQPDSQSQYDLSPLQIFQQAQQNAQKAQAQQQQVAKIGSMANLPTAIQSVAASQIPMQGMGGMGGDVTGEDYLKTLQPVFAAHVKAVGEGREPYPMGQSAKSPLGVATVNALTQAYPGYDATTWAERSKTAKDFSPGGVSGQKITAAQTAINHLGAMMDASQGVGGVNASFASKPINAIGNYFNNQDPNVITYNRFADMSGDEIAKFVAGTSGSTEADRRDQENKLSINNSPDARKAAAQAAVQAVFGKLEPLADQYNKAYGTNKTPADFLSDQTKSSLSKLGMLPDNASSLPAPTNTSNGTGQPIDLSHYSTEQLLTLRKQHAR